MKAFVSLPFSRLALTKSSVLSDTVTVTFAEPMFQVSVMIGFVTASLVCLRLDFKQGAIPCTKCRFELLEFFLFELYSFE